MLDGELEIAILKSISNTLLKRSNQVVHCPNFHHPFDLPSWHEAQSHGCNDPEEAVSAVNQPKQLWVLRTATHVGSSRCIYKNEGFNIADKGFHLQTAAVRVSGNCSRDCQSIGTSLLLAIPQVSPSRLCKERYPSISSGHSIPASTSRIPCLRSKLSTRLIFLTSISMVSVPNCCPPMACRPPETEITLRSLRSLRTILCTSSRDRGCEIASTRVGLSWE